MPDVVQILLEELEKRPIYAKCRRNLPPVYDVYNHPMKLLHQASSSDLCVHWSVRFGDIHVCALKVLQLSCAFLNVLH